MSDSDLRVKTQLNIAKPAAEIFEAIVNPAQMAGYFITSGTGRLDEGRPVTWSWTDHGVELTITPQEIEPPKKIVFSWPASGAPSRVEFDLEPAGDGETLVRVTDGDWPPDAQGTARCLEQMQGWVHMLCCLKAYLEFGINLRTGSSSRAAAG